MEAKGTPESANPPAPLSQRLAGQAQSLFGMRRRVLECTAAAVAFLLIYAWGGALHIPAHSKYGASLFWEAGRLGGVANLLLTAIGLLAVLIVATIIAGRERNESGLLAACIGLGALSVRGGTLGDVLRTQGASPAVLILLAGEVIFLFVFVGGAWAVTWLATERGWLKRDPLPENLKEADESLGQKITATVAHALIVFTAVSLLARTDAKAQVLWSVFFAGLLGSTGAFSLAPVRQSIWYCAGPLLVALVGYLGTWFSPDGWMTGQLQGPLGALARPLPLDYASAGPAGALVGLWIAHGWFKKPEEAEANS